MAPSTVSDNSSQTSTASSLKSITQKTGRAIRKASLNVKKVVAQFAGKSGNRIKQTAQQATKRLKHRSPRRVETDSSEDEGDINVENDGEGLLIIFPV
jgi:hypothetical protein